MDWQSCDQSPGKLARGSKRELRLPGKSRTVEAKTDLVASKHPHDDRPGGSTPASDYRRDSVSPAPEHTLDLTLVPPQQLTSAEVEAWAQLQASNPALDNPFFDFAFVRAQGAVSEEVEVGVMRQAGEIVGFFPYERDSWNRGWPVGRRLSDFHGIISADGLVFDAEELMKKCKLRSWHFNNLVTTQPFERSRRELVESGYIDLTCGMAAYEQGRKDAGSSLLAQIRRKERKIEREVGALRFVWASNDQRAFEKMMEWKSAQRRRTRTPDPMKSDKVVMFLDQLKDISEPDFSGLLSVLYVGDEIAAVHLGIHNASVINICFPTYNSEFAKYSPGLILFVRLMESCVDKGIQRIDLGAGKERYKSSLMTGSHSLGRGIVGLGIGSTAVYSGYHWVRKMSRHRLLEQQVKRLKHSLRGLRLRVRGS